MLKKNTIQQQEARDAFILLLPLLLLMLIFTVYPVLSNFYYSMTKWKGFGTAEWVGFKNFARAFQDVKFWYSLKNLGILILYIPIGVFIPLLLAAILREGLKGWQFFRSIIYLPTILGYVILGTLFSVIFSQTGPITELLTRLGFENANTINLLGKSNSAIHMIAILFVLFTKLGFGTIYFLAAMSSISSSLYDAAKIDGAGWWRTFFNITVPGISFSVQFFVVLQFIEVFARMYSFIYTLTYGGPGFATYTLEFGIYRQGFQAFKMGYASSWAVILFVCCAIIAAAQIRIIKKGEILK
ncbi:MAG: sugar ABC transporter permease [Spirochaetales bacterium]|nr:sugar ABC transporter permease [Spirochaetales bacterium]